MPLREEIQPSVTTQEGRVQNPLKLVLTDEQKKRLLDYLHEEFTFADSAHYPQRAKWKNALRMYEGQPQVASRDYPLVDMKNIEVVIGAIASDSIYAQGLDMVWAVSPLLTVLANRKGDETKVAGAADLQDFVNWLVPIVGFATAHEHAWLDDVQLGTGIYYIPMIEESRKTRLGANARRKILTKRPIVYPVPPEDIKIPAGKGLRVIDINTSPWFAHRFYYSLAELNEFVALKGWNLPPKMAPAEMDEVTMQRIKRAQTTHTAKSEAESLYQVWATHVFFDIDNDGIREDLLVFYDFSANYLFSVEWNPYDRRPYEKQCYQKRAHMFYGIGVLEMLASMEEEVTQIHNDRNLNMTLANTRAFTGPPDANGGSSTVRLWPNRYLPTMDPNGVKPIPLADVYPSSAQAEAITMSLAERRVGVNEMSTPRPSQVLGSRTPGITAVSMLQQVNRRFTPAFNDMRNAAGGAIKQCLYRVQERLLAKDKDIADWIMKAMGAEKSGRIMAILTDENFENDFTVTLTASSTNTNRDVARRDMFVLVNMLSTYYQKAIELVSIASNPQTPPPVVEVAQKIAKAATELIERALRTFDDVSDPENFLVEMNDTLDKLDLPQEGLAGLAQLLGSMPAPVPANQGLDGII